MRKLFFLVLLIVVGVGLAVGDYYLNLHATLPKLPTDKTVTDVRDLSPNLVATLLALDPRGFGYQISERVRTDQIFEKMDLSASKLAIFRSRLKDADGVLPPLTIYEIHGAPSQGSLTYLNVKLKFIDQLSAVETINETGEYGSNSFFLNDLNYKNTGFLVAQIGDNIFGFEYDKTHSQSFNSIKRMIDAYKLIHLPS